MAATLVATGSIAAIANNAITQSVTLPTYTYDGGAGQFHLLLLQKNATAFTLSAPVGWTQVFQNDHDPVSGREHVTAAFVKAAESGDSGTSITVSQGAAGGFTVFAGVAFTFAGGNTSGLLDATAAAVLENEPSDNVTFPAYDSTSTDVTLFALGFYADDTTTFAASFGTPTFTTVADVETATGTDLSMAVALAAGDGSAVSAGNTWATSSAVDNASTGVLFAVVNAGGGGGGGSTVPVKMRSYRQRRAA